MTNTEYRVHVSSKARVLSRMQLPFRVKRNHLIYFN